MKCFLRRRSKTQADWQESPLEVVELSRLPHVGEYVRLGTEAADYYCVRMVVHTAAPAEVAGEIFCVQGSYFEATRFAGLMAP